MTAGTASRVTPRRVVGATSRVVLVLAGGTALGILLVAAGHRFGPAAVVALPAVVAVVLVTQTRPWTALALVVLAVPVGFVSLPVAGLQGIEAAALAAGGLTVLARLTAGRAPLAWPAVAWWPAAILAAAVASTVGATDVGMSTKQLALLVVGLLVLLTAATVARDLPALRRVTTLFAVVGAGVCLHGLTGAGQLDARGGGVAVDNRPTGIFTSPNQLGAFAGMVVLVGLGLLVGARRPGERLAGAVAALGGLVGLVVTLSRGAWLATAVAVAVYAVVVPQVRRTFARWLVPVVVVGGLVAGLALPAASTQVEVVQERFGTLATGQTSKYDSRTTIWAEAVRQVEQRPLLGQGPANFPVVSRRSVSEATTVGANHAHNTVLNVAAEFGIVGLLLLVGFALALMRRLRRTLRVLRPADRGLVAGCGAAVLVQAVHGMVDYTLRNAVLAVVTWLLAGLVVAAGEGRVR